MFTTSRLYFLLLHCLQTCLPPLLFLYFLPTVAQFPPASCCPTAPSVVGKQVNMVVNLFANQSGTETSFFTTCTFALTEFLCLIPFLTQTFLFILAWDQHQEYTGLLRVCSNCANPSWLGYVFLLLYMGNLSLGFVLQAFFVFVICQIYFNISDILNQQLAY